ncbi:hypothetical protein PISMIDRAFT_675139 [Pisolithus microcarpus 441]|uniref:Uncharacterized protein n=1 Tax=Pisolithus microcarpus 441 TaxID=765257 RepID=A0A0C9ZYG4_9AGAM|nr:hypothetical protein PISMIDRAFT_675139 [Pisolithus microcarpus 441]
MARDGTTGDTARLTCWSELKAHTHSYGQGVSMGRSCCGIAVRREKEFLSKVLQSPPAAPGPTTHE